MNTNVSFTSVSDPHTLNADPDADPGLWLNTDPILDSGSGSWILDPDPGSQYLFLIKLKNIFDCIFSGISQHQYLAVESYVIQKILFEVMYKSHFLYELKESKLNYRIQDPHSEYGSRIRIPEAAEYRTNADPEHCHLQYGTMVIIFIFVFYYKYSEIHWAIFLWLNYYFLAIKSTN